MHVVSLSQCPEQPWRNGGGTTRELLTWPATADWTLRISVARIARDGPFSAYPGISRWFTVLSGGGVELSWPGRQVQLSPGTAPLPFDGQDAPGCRLLAGATEDLNLMLRRDRARGSLQAVQPGQPWSAAAGWRGLYTADACTLHTAHAQKQEAAVTHASLAYAPLAHALPAHSLAWDDEAAAGAWWLQADTPPRAWWVHLQGLPA